MDDAPPVLGVAEIVLSVADLPAMRTFYAEVLGFAVHSEASMEAEQHDPDGAATITFLTIRQLDSPLGRLHPQMLVLIDHRRHVFAKERLIGHDVQRTTLNHLAFEIPSESYLAHFDRLNRLGLDPVEAEFPSMNAKAIFFKDPEGNALELICSAN